MSFDRPSPHSAVETPSPTWLTSRQLPWLLAGLSVALTLPGLWVGWQVDDWFHQALLRGVRLPIRDGNLWSQFFDFFGSDPARAAAMQDLGFAPWWLPTDFQVRFYRPVTVATHLLDHLIAPTSAVFAHAHSIAWSAAVVAMATVLFRRFYGLTALAGVAALLYALDESRGVPTGWVANRSALVSVFFGIACLLIHDSWRRQRWAPARWIGPALFALALLSAEAGIATIAYIFAYAVCMESGPRWRRAATFLPYAIVVVVWRIGYNKAGFGASGSGLYIDPVGHPLRFLIAAVDRWPILLAGQWTSIPTVVVAFLPASLARLAWAVAVLILGAVGALFWPVLRRSATARMWATGMLLAAIPICATFPANRLLGFVGLGGAALLAEIAEHYGAPGLAWLRRRRDKACHSKRRLVVQVAMLVTLLSGLIALPAGTYAIAGLADVLVDPCERAVSTSAAIRDKTVIFVNANSLCSGYMPVRRLVLGVPTPRRVRLLASAIYEVHITGVDAHTIDVRAVGGFQSLPADQLVRSREDPLPLGHRVTLPGMTIEVVKLTAAGLVSTVRLRFARRLRDPHLIWIATRGRASAVITPPQPGQTRVLPSAF